jgi:hypothetical protein
MSLAHTAEYLKKHGRGPDDQLVHMSSNELRGLQQVAKAHGGSLTINPHTGLPEAGFLDSMLPMVLGAGLMATGIGAPAAALMVGTGYGIAKHDLNAGLMAGLGAYGGAGLMGGLSAAGAGAAADVATTAAADEAAKVAGEEAAKQAATQGLDQTAQEAAKRTAIDEASNATARTAANSATPSLSNAGKGLASLGGETGRSLAYANMPQGTLPAAGFAFANALTPQQGVPNQLESPNSNPMGLARLSPNFKGYEPQQPNPYYKAQYEDYTKNPYSIKPMAEGGIAFDTGGTVEQMSNQNALGNNSMYPQSGLGNLTNTNVYQNPINTPESTSVVGPTDAMTDTYTGQMKFAGGGHLPASPSIPDVGIFYDNDLTTKNLPAWNAAQAKNKQIAKRSNIKPTDLPKTAIEKLGGDFSDAGASGGIATLGSYSDGGRLLKGPGDGMSDNIPAQIGKHQPARLADGEFVVPADVVSHLGNGSTDAGAKKLNSMMDKIRKARTGRKTQGKQVNANKFLPT